ncbi:MAG: sensor histidine kinase [Vicinamibacterales bacterium]
MGLGLTRLRRPHAMWLAIAAASCAAVLVLYFQHRALSTLQSQTRVILRQISEQTATDVASAVRRTLDGPVFETLTAVNHPELREGRLDLVANEYREGLNEYPHVDRFFVWSEQTDAVAPGEALFYGREHPAGHTLSVGPAGTPLMRDAVLGHAILDLARDNAPAQHIYVAAENVGPDRHQVFLRLFWKDARRVDYFAVLGFVVHPATLRKQFFPALFARELEALVAHRAGEIQLSLSVTDETGALVFGRRAAEAATARVPVPMLIYPVDRIESRLTTALPARTWQIEVSAPERDALLGGVSRSYWPTIVSVLLMMVIVGLTVQANRRSAELAQMQSDFIAHASHQLKTPLSLLSAATETLEMDRVRSPEKLAEYLGIIRGEATRLTALFQRVLEFSRLQQRRSYEFETVDLSALVRETVEAFAGSLAEQPFTFDVQQDGSPLCVRADSAALEQVVANLLDNAVKYSDGVQEVIVRVRGTDRVVTVEVVDRGVGIALDQQRRIFERFYRAPTSAHRPGFGLGLPIVQEVVRAHGGRVEVKSAPGQGSTFCLVLPRDLAGSERESDVVDGLPEASR